MGLFDFMNTGDPEKDSMIREGLLQFGLGLMSSRGRTLPAIGNAGRQSLSAMDAYKQRQFQGKLNDYQLKQLQQAEALSKLPGKYITPGSPEVQGNNPSAYTPAVPESMDLRGLANAYMAAPGGLPTGLQLQSMLKKDAPQFHSLAPGAKGFFTGPDGRQVGGIIENPKPIEPKKQPNSYEEWLLAKEDGYKKSYADWVKEKTPKTEVSVNTGEKGFKNELALKSDFRAEPIYKDYSEMVSAYKQIKAGIAQGNPIGDLTTATKIMKLLDPTSVVRESELGMAMAATGRMDRLKNFVDLQIKGHKLTTQQRQEFGTLADELYDAAGQAYNQKYSEYENIGKRYQLNTEGLGPKHAPVRKKSVRQEADAIIGGG